MLTATLQKRILDSLTTAVLLIDKHLLITYLNPAAEILFETSEKRICGQAVSNIFFENKETEAELIDALESDHPYIKREALISSGNSSGNKSKELTVNYSVSTLIEPDCEKLLLLEFQPLDRLLRISRDETLLNNQLATKALIRGMAHEVKNPLGGIRGAAQLLEKELVDEEQKEYTQVIIDEVDRLKILVDRMLGPRTPPKIELLNIHEALEYVVSVTKAESGKAVEIVKDYDPSIPEINIDRDQLIQASLNILSNARQALIENEQVDAKVIIRTRILRQFTIASKRHRIVIRIDFVDNGPGIPQNIKETIFYPMVSGRASGTGLGLSIAQSIINQFEGLIECKSKPGETIFSLLLPMRNA